MEYRNGTERQADKVAAGRRLVSLDHVRQNNIVVTKLESQLKETVFEQEYRQAALVIRNILRRNAEEEKKQSYSRGDLPWQNPERLDSTYSEFQTAVPFIGDRGSGKSSMMYSVLRRLDNYNHCAEDNAPTEERQKRAFWLGEENSTVRFVTLDMIDANVLKRTEDLLEIILSRLLALLEDLDNSGRHDLRELYRKLSELYKSMHNLYWQDSFRAEEAGIVGLKRLADSQRAIRSFQEFVAQLLLWLGSNVYRQQIVYLVIALDDVDMYQGSKNDKEGDRFWLLQQIYDYLRIPGVIVLMTFNENILRQNCLRHFRRVYLGTERSTEETPAEQDQIDSLARQFLLKLFPQEQRIYLPDFQRMDSTGVPNLYVVPVLESEDRERPLSPFSINEKAVPVKEFMLRLIAYKTGVYFDMTGTKKHFFEPRNLRELGTLFQIIYGMQDVGTDPQKKVEIQAANRRALLQYIYNQFAGSYLNVEEYKSLQNLAMLPLVRQERELVDRIRRHRKDLGLTADDFGYIDQVWEKKRWKYSYGELLQNLYYATRVPKQKGKENLFLSKPYIHCVLASHSILLAETAVDAQARKKWKRVFGSSLAGRWANDMLPVLFDQDVEQGTGVGSISLPLRQFFGWELPKDLIKNIVGLGKPANSLEKEDAPSESQAYIRQFMVDFVLLGMFFTGLPRTGMKLELCAAKYVQNGKDSFVWSLCSNTMDEVCFNAFNFVINSFIAVNPFAENEKPYFAYMKQTLQELGNRIVRDIEETESKAGTIEGNLDTLNEQRSKATTREIVDQLDGEIAAFEKMRATYNGWKNAGAKAAKYELVQKNWNAILEELLGGGGQKGSLQEKLSQWEERHADCPFLVPVQHFDMMYNLIKRLADTSYQDISPEGSVNDAYEHYVSLYQNLREELNQEENAYKGAKGIGLTNAFTESFFYRTFVERPTQGQDPAGKKKAAPASHIREFFNRMIETAIPYQNARERQRNQRNDLTLDDLF